MADILLDKLFIPDAPVCPRNIKFPQGNGVFIVMGCYET